MVTLPPPAPLHIAEGTGLTVVRGGEFYASMLAGQYLAADHQQYSPGHIEVMRGADRLVITAQNITRNQTPSVKCRESNTFIVNDPRGVTAQNYPFNMGQWYG